MSDFKKIVISLLRTYCLSHSWNLTDSRFRKYLIFMPLLVMNIVFFTGLLQTLPASAEIYKWTDSAGKTHFSDKPHSGSRQLKLKSGIAWHTVRKVYDGDTVMLQNGLKIRLLGINTPEVEGRYKVAEPGGEEAKHRLMEILRGKQVRLQMDVEKQDKYKRTLAHLFTRDGFHVNLEMVKRGLAFVNIHTPNLQYADDLVQAGEQAEADGPGIWGREEYSARPFASIARGKDKGWMRLTGRVQAIRRSRRYSYLEFSRQADIRIANANLSLFPVLSEYMGKELEIRGWPSRSKGHYSVLIRHPSALKIIY